MESKLHIIRKKRSDLENSRLDPLMRALAEICGRHGGLCTAPAHRKT